MPFHFLPNQFKPQHVLVFCILILTTGCISNPENNFQIQIIETSSETFVTNEIVRLNNCNGDLPVEQISQRAQTIDLSDSTDEAYKTLLTQKYFRTAGISKSVKMEARGGSDMEYTLAWTEQVSTGTIRVVGGFDTVTYRISTPIQVDLNNSGQIPCHVSAEATPQPIEKYYQAQAIGYPFTNKKATIRTGDLSAAGHLFLHRFDMPENGFLTGLTYANDIEINMHEAPETVIVLILRPVDGGYTVIHQVELTDDTPPAAYYGTVTLIFETPLPVRRGDILAHWQEGATGPIPFNSDHDEPNTMALSQGKAGFSKDDIAIGKFISKDGFSGMRDYFINALFATNP